MNTILNQELAQAKILNYIKFHKINTRTALATKLGITRSAITRTTNLMLEKGLIITRGVFENRQVKGRNSEILCINNAYKQSIGITLDVDGLKYILATINGLVVDVGLWPLGSSYHDILSSITACVSDIIRRHALNNDTLLGIGVCISEQISDVYEELEKPVKVRKDLSHAIAYKLMVRPIVFGLLTAQRLFVDDPIISGCALSIRCNEKMTHGFSVNTHIHSPIVKNEFSVVTLDLDEEQIVSGIAARINECIELLAPNNVYVLGSYLMGTDRLKLVSGLIDTRFKVKLTPCVVQETTIALSGASLVVDSLFYNNNNL